MGKKNRPADKAISFDEKTLSITELKKIWGTKKQDDGTLIITSYKGEDKDVVIPSSFGKVEVTAIDPETFSPFVPRLNDIQQKIRTEIASISFPGSIREIPENMFTRDYSSTGRPALKRIVLGEGISKICDRAFYGCNGIEEISIPESVREIGTYAFEGCTKLKKITIPSHITIMPQGLFDNTGFENFVVEDQFTTIGEGIFYGCKKLKSIKLPSFMTEIPSSMFKGCVALQNFDFPASVTSIGRYAFADSGLKKVEIPDGIKTIGDGAFSGCRKLEKIKIPKDAVIGESAFSDCDALADKDGIIVVGNIFYGILNPNGYGELSPKLQIKPVIIGENIKKVSVPIYKLPQIVCREYDGEGNTISIDSIAVGDSVEFGRFPIDNTYKMNPIKWMVLAKEDEKVLLVSTNDIISLDRCVKQEGVWADSYVRKMLNNGFINVAFTEKERKQIVTVTVNTPKNKKNEIDGGPDTKDKIFLLSVEEVEKYLPNQESRKSKPTEYAYKQRPTKRDWGYWQLRTPGKSYFGSVAVSDDSGDYCAMTGDHSGYSYVRPAMWVKNI